MKENTIKNLKYDKEILEILLNRGIENSDIDMFLEGKLENLMNPLDFKDIDKAVERLRKAVEEKENIWIYGDYDVDGITSTSLCYLALKCLGANVQYYIPLRDEGYGLNKDALKYIYDEKGKLIITVDCGISSIMEVEYANSLNLEMIITDHHEINNDLPDAYAVINPKRKDNRDGYKILAGVGTAFMLMLQLYRELGREEEIYQYLDIVAIGTIADIVPLIGYNRILTKEGLKLLKSSKHLGLNMLLKKIYDSPKEKKFDTYDVGFVIAPIFNAAGRLEDAKKAVELMILDDHVVISKIIDELVGKNIERKEIQEEIFQKAIEKIENKNLIEKEIIMVAEEGFHHGVIGIVASKILDRYYKPTIIMEKKNNEGIAVASCRSTEGFNMIEALNSMRDLFVKYGGHAGAAGLTIEIDKIDEFYERLNEYAKINIKEEEKKRGIKIDTIIPAVKISYDLMKKMEILEPFGFGNSAPIFLMKNCRFSNFREIGKDKNHLMIDIEKDGIDIKNCVWFNSNDIFEELKKCNKIDVVFKLKMETYKDKYLYKMYIEDIKKSKNDESEVEFLKNLKNIKFPINSVFYTRKQDLNGNININILNEDVTVNIGSKNIGFLDFQTKKLLQKLNKYYGMRFIAKIKAIEKKDENNNVFIEIDRDNSFTSYAIKKGEIFKEIKEFLIGDLEYNTIQKNVLRMIFKEEKKVIVNMERGRGINTIVKTIKLYFEQLGEKVGFLPNDEVADFYIYIGEDIEMIKKSNLSFVTKKIELDNFEYIYDLYNIKKNVKIIDMEKIIDIKNTFFRENTNENKRELIEKVEKEEFVLGTEFIKIIF